MNNSTATAEILPFRFDTREVRTLLIDDQPWFVASDVARALEYREAERFTRWLDDDERGTQIVGTPSGDQGMTIINESGLYSAILRSRKPNPPKPALKPACFSGSLKRNNRF